MTTTDRPATIEQITASLTDVVAGELGVPAADVAPDTDLRTMDGADSVKVLRVVAKIEREYDVELEDEDVFGSSTVAEVAAVVHKALEQR